jgi:hypothetical protein
VLADSGNTDTCPKPQGFALRHPSTTKRERRFAAERLAHGMNIRAPLAGQPPPPEGELSEPPSPTPQPQPATSRNRPFRSDCTVQQSSTQSRRGPDHRTESRSTEPPVTQNRRLSPLGFPGFNGTERSRNRASARELKGDAQHVQQQEDLSATPLRPQEPRGRGLARGLTLAPREWPEPDGSGHSRGAALDGSYARVRYTCTLSQKVRPTCLRLLLSSGPNVSTHKSRPRTARPSPPHAAADETGTDGDQAPFQEPCPFLGVTACRLEPHRA